MLKKIFIPIAAVIAMCFTSCQEETIVEDTLTSIEKKIDYLNFELEEVTEQEAKKYIEEYKFFYNKMLEGLILDLNTSPNWKTFKQHDVYPEKEGMMSTVKIDTPNNDVFKLTLIFGKIEGKIECYVNAVYAYRLTSDLKIIDCEVFLNHLTGHPLEHYEIKDGKFHGFLDRNRYVTAQRSPQANVLDDKQKWFKENIRLNNKNENLNRTKRSDVHKEYQNKLNDILTKNSNDNDCVTLEDIQKTMYLSICLEMQD